MTCNHQWHDATSSAGPEWVCAKCKVNYSEIKKTLSAPKRPWVGLTDEEFDYLRDNNFGVSPLISAVEAKLKEKNNG